MVYIRFFIFLRVVFKRGFECGYFFECLIYWRRRSVKCRRIYLGFVRSVFKEKGRRLGLFLFKASRIDLVVVFEFGRRRYVLRDFRL